MCSFVFCYHKIYLIGEGFSYSLSLCHSAIWRLGEDRTSFQWCRAVPVHLSPPSSNRPMTWNKNYHKFENFWKWDSSDCRANVCKFHTKGPEFIGFFFIREKQLFTVNSGQNWNYHDDTRYTVIIWVIKSHYWEWYGIFNPYIMIDDHGCDGNHINGIIELTDKGIGVRQ